MISKYKYFGMWPVAPTPFHDNGEVDYDGMERVLDCMVDQKVQVHALELKILQIDLVFPNQNLHLYLQIF